MLSRRLQRGPVKIFVSRGFPLWTGGRRIPSCFLCNFLHNSLHQKLHIGAWGLKLEVWGFLVSRDDEIKKLCMKVLRQAEDLEAYQAALSELRAAIHDHFAKIESLHLVPKKRQDWDGLKNGTTG